MLIQLNFFYRFSIILYLLLANAVLGAYVYLYPHIYFHCGPIFFIFSLIVVTLAILFWRFNLLFQSRILLLGIIGYFAGFVKAMDPSAAYSPVGIDTQTLEVGAQMYGLTSVALFGAFVGLKLGFDQNNPHLSKWVGTSRLMPDSYFNYFFALIIILIVGYFSAISYGDSVFISGYASGTGQSQLLGNLQIIGVIGMVIATTAAVKIQKKWAYWGLVFIGMYFFIWGILIRGGRAEVLSGFFAIFVALAAAKGEIARLTKRDILAIIFIGLFMEAWGVLRSSLSRMGEENETIMEGYIRLFDQGIYFAGTISGIATTFSNIIHMIENSVLDFNFGQSYFDYLLRSPPEFLYPERPRDLAWIFPDYGYSAIGGFFELAEAFYSFGLLGCFFIPFIISFIISRSYSKAMRGSFLWLFICAGIWAATFRGGWYQTFAYYKSILTGIILYLIFIKCAAGIKLWRS